MPSKRLFHWSCFLFQPFRFNSFHIVPVKFNCMLQYNACTVRRRKFSETCCCCSGAHVHFKCTRNVFRLCTYRVFLHEHKRFLLQKWIGYKVFTHHTVTSLQSHRRQLQLRDVYGVMKWAFCSSILAKRLQFPPQRSLWWTRHFPSLSRGHASTCSWSVRFCKVHGQK